MLVPASLEQRVLRPVVFTRPKRLVWPPSWAAHLPFAFWIVDALRPRTFVELGTHTGDSYSAFVQASQWLGLGTACYAIDTWTGDEQAGFYGEDVYQEWSAFHDTHFADCSRLIRATFDTALTHFADGSIDLLHIDGLHTYEAVRHDFETWRPKVSDRGVVLFHDVNVREGDFGAWRYWAELQGSDSSFTFLHGHGLGVLAVGRDLAPEIAWLLRLSESEAVQVRRFFATVGEVWTTHIMLDRARHDIVSAQKALAASRSDLASAANTRDQAQAAADRLGTELLEAEARVRLVDDAWSERLRTAESQAQAVGVGAEARTAEARAELEASRASLEAAHAGLEATRGQVEELERALQSSRDVGTRMAAEVTRVQRSMVGRSLDERAGYDAVILTALHRSSPRSTPSSSGGPLERWVRWSGIDAARLRRHPVGSARALAAVASPDYRQRLALLESSGLFDERFYAAHEAVRGLAPVRLRQHFIRHGDSAGLSPHPLFDTAWYRGRNADLPAGTPLLFHYLSFGAGEGRDPHPLFDTAVYLSRINDRPAAGISPLSHFMHEGASAGVSPHALFDISHYLRQGPGALAAGVNPLLHYLTTAEAEPRDPHPLFSTRHYVATNPDIGSANPLLHFIRHGATEGRSPHPLFDLGHYLRQRPDVLHAGVDALSHYLHVAHVEDVDPHPLFDTSQYLEQVPELRARGMNPLVHFVEFGWRLGLRPNPWFDPLWYRERWSIEPGLNPLLHYIDGGWRQGLDPSPDFSIAGYLQQHPEVIADRSEPLAHYLQSQRQMTRRRS